MKYKYKGSMFFSLLIGLLVLSVTCSFGLAGVNLYKNFRSYYLKQDAEAIVRALDFYSLSHVAVNTTSFTLDAEGNPVYKKIRSYPVSLSEIHELQKAGYFSGKIEFNSSTDFDVFNYTPVTNTYNGNVVVTGYRLSVKLPNGNTYIKDSPTENL